LTAAEVETASRRFKKALIERALGGELTRHLGYPSESPSPSSPRITATAATKLIWLALRNITAKWARAALSWRRP
jgi:transposase-like protein